jgi:hypothetical protein
MHITVAFYADLKQCDIKSILTLCAKFEILRIKRGGARILLVFQNLP